jgi:hypothetical protein
MKKEDEELIKLIIANAELKASEQIKEEIDEYIKSGKLDKEIDESLKESWWEKLINKLW